MPDNVQWVPLPKSTATTSWELLEDIIRAITEEPRRYAQDTWREIFRDDLGVSDVEMSRVALVERVAEGRVPACGSIGCVAGWVTFITDEIPSYSGDTGYKAACILGINPDQRNELFHGNALRMLYWTENPAEYERQKQDYEDNSDGRSFDDAPDVEPKNMPVYGTPEYAALGVRHIRAFMAKYEEQLKNTKLGTEGRDAD